jgi:hypothetical protein
LGEKAPVARRAAVLRVRASVGYGNADVFGAEAEPLFIARASSSSLCGRLAVLSHGDQLFCRTRPARIRELPTPGCGLVRCTPLRSVVVLACPPLNSTYTPPLMNVSDVVPESFTVPPESTTVPSNVPPESTTSNPLPETVQLYSQPKFWHFHNVMVTTIMMIPAMINLIILASFCQIYNYKLLID